MGVVGHQPGVVLGGDIGQLADGRQVAVHGKHAVGDDQRPGVVSAVGFHEPAKMPGVVVAEDVQRPPGQLGAGENAGVGKLVHRHHVVGARERRDDAGVGQIPGAEHARRFRPFQCRQLRLKHGEQRVVAGHQPRRAGADAVLLRRLDGGGLDGLVLGKVEIVVARKRDQALAPALNLDGAQALGLDEGAQQVPLLEGGQLLLGEFIQGRGHAQPPPTTLTTASVSRVRSSSSIVKAGIR